MLYKWCTICDSSSFYATITDSDYMMSTKSKEMRERIKEEVLSMFDSFVGYESSEV